MCTPHVLRVKQLQGTDWLKRGPVMEEGVDLSHAAPVPAGGAGQHLGQAMGVGPAVVPLIPQQLAVGPRQPGRGREEGEA